MVCTHLGGWVFVFLIFLALLLFFLQLLFSLGGNLGWAGKVRRMEVGNT